MDRAVRDTPRRAPADRSGVVTTTLRSMLAALSVLARGELSRYGPQTSSEVSRFEDEMRAFFGVRHALGLNSGTSALVCALVGAGVGPGDEVLVPAYTWISTAAAPVAVGATPVLVEIDASLTIDLDDAAAKVTERTRAVVPVHMGNLVADMAGVRELAARHGLAVVEDACQAIGVRYGARPVGSLGDAGAFSFNQHKNIYSGEGGALITDDDEVFERALVFHDVGNHERRGRARPSVPPFVGLGLRMPEIAAAVLRPQLRRLEDQIAARRRHRRIALEALDRLPYPFTVCPHHDEGAAAGLAVTFDDERHARNVAQGRGVTRLIDSGRHLYRNWTPVIEGRTHDPRVDRVVWPAGPTAPCLPATEDVLARTCGVALAPELPDLVFRRLLSRVVAGARD